MVQNVRFLLTNYTIQEMVRMEAGLIVAGLILTRIRMRMEFLGRRWVRVMFLCINSRTSARTAEAS